MLPADKPEMVRVLTGLAAIKPGAKLTPEGLETWWQAMRAWSLEDFKSAASFLAGTHEFMPNPFHFEQLRRAGRATAGEAWARAVAAARRGGGTDCPLIEKAVQAMGGWLVLRMSDEDKLHFLERRFAEHYDDIRDADDTRDAIPAIASTWRPALSGPRHVSALLPKPSGDTP